MIYKAFISYSHQPDAQLASALQTGLHRFGKPWYRLRALRLYRDQTNLSVTPGLWPRIVEALESSEMFLLLASPEAAESKWIDREIAWWLDSRGPGKILLVLTHGNLVWDETRGGFCPERSTGLNSRLVDAFPEEPLWLDLRWIEQDSHLSLRNGRFKDAIAGISAALQGVSKDSLIGEDQRQHRRTKIVSWTAISLLCALTLATAAFAWLADRQRSAAERRLVDLLYTPSGLQSLRGGDWAVALLWFVEALELDTGDSEWEPLHRARIAFILAGHPRLIDVHFHEDRVIDVALGADGTVLSASRDGDIQISRPNSRMHRRFQIDVSGVLKKVELGLGSSRLLAIEAEPFTDERKAWLWDLAEGVRINWRSRDEAREVLPVADAALRGQIVVFRPPGLETWSSSDGSQTSDYSDWTGVAPYSGELFVSPSGKFAALVGVSGSAVDEGNIQVWDVGARTAILDKIPGTLVAFDSRDRWLAVGQRDGNVALWDLARGQKIEKPLFSWGDSDEHRTPIILEKPATHLMFVTSGDRDALVTADDEGSLRIWDVIDGRALSDKRVHSGGINHLAIAESALSVATAGVNDGVRLWSLDPSAKSRQLPTLRHGSWYREDFWDGPGGVLAVAYSVDGQYLVSGGTDGTARVWQTQSVGPKMLDSDISELDWDPPRALIDGGGGSAVSRDADPLRLNNLAPQKAFRGISRGRDGRYVAATDRAGVVEVWDSLTKRQIASGLGPVEGYVIAADLIPGTNRIVIADENAASVWHTATSRRAGSLMRHRGILALLVSPDGGRIITVGAQSFRLWNAKTGEPLTGIRRLPVTISSVRYSADGRWLLVTWADGGQLYSARTGRAATLPVRWDQLADRFTVVSGPGRLKILQSTGMGTVTQWDFSPTLLSVLDLRTLAQVLSNRRIDEARSLVPLTREEFESAWKALPRHLRAGTDAGGHASGPGSP